MFKFKTLLIVGIYRSQADIGDIIPMNSVTYYYIGYAMKCDTMKWALMYYQYTPKLLDWLDWMDWPLFLTLSRTAIEKKAKIEKGEVLDPF